MKPAIVITTYNEAKSIYNLVRFFADDYPVVVVDDGSTDQTDFIAEMAGARVAQTGGGFGIAQSLMLGWTMALRDYHWDVTHVLQIDAGGSHQPEDAVEFFAREAVTRADLVIGSRFRRGANYLGQQTLRPFMSRVAATMCNLAQLGARHTDWTSGYRLFSRELLLHLLKQRYIATMHGWQMEVLAHAWSAGFRTTEVPITYIPGRSSFNWRVANEAFNSWLHIAHHIRSIHEPR